MFEEMFSQMQKNAAPWMRLWTSAATVEPESLNRWVADGHALRDHATDATRQAVDRWAEATRASVDWGSEVLGGMSEASLEATRAVLGTLRTVGQAAQRSAAGAANSESPPK